MQQASIVAQQVLLIFMYIAIGASCAKLGILSQENGRGIAGFTHRIVTPSVLIISLMRPRDAESVRGLALAYVLAFVFFSVALFVAAVAIRKREDNRYRTERFGVMFSNCGFMAIPLATAVAGEVAAFYLVAFISVLQMLLWSVGYMLITGEKRIHMGRVLRSPGVVATAIGLLLFFTQIPVPDVLRKALSSVAAMNSPLAMITVGVFLSGIAVDRRLLHPRLLYMSFLRLLVCPIISLAIIRLLGVVHWSAQAPVIIFAGTMAGACPSPASTSNFPAMLGYDGEYGAQIIAITTVLSIFTLPAVTWLSQYLI